MKAWRKIKSWFTELATAPASPRPFAVLRIALTSILLLQSLFIVKDFLQLYSPQGYLQGDLRRYLLAPALPFYVDWESLGSLLGISAERLVRGTFLTYVGSLVFLLLGFHSRIASVVAWFSHFLLKLNLGYNSSYGVDTFSHIALFYLMFFPMNRMWSLDCFLGRVKGQPLRWSRISLRVLQFHLFIIYFSTGMEKIAGWQWRTGEVMWRAWNLPQFRVFDMTWLAWYPFIAKGLAWSTLFMEIGYPVLLGFKPTRKAAALGIVGLHAGIAFTMHLWTFSAVMITLTVCAFLVSAEPVVDPLRNTAIATSLPAWLNLKLRSSKLSA